MLAVYLMATKLGVPLWLFVCLLTFLLVVCCNQTQVLAVYLMAAKLGVPVCPHAGGVGLCNMVPHLQVQHHLPHVPHLSHLHHLHHRLHYLNHHYQLDLDHHHKSVCPKKVKFRSRNQFFKIFRSSVFAGFLFANLIFVTSFFAVLPYIIEL